jgi:hypothetical protein
MSSEPNEPTPVVVIAEDPLSMAPKPEDIDPAPSVPTEVI